MYGMPNDRPLSIAVRTLTEAHQHTYGTMSGIEPALLLLLRDAVATSSGRGSAPGGGGSKASAPVDAAALTLWESISGTVDAHWPGRFERGQHSQPLPYKLQSWTRSVVDGENEAHLLEMAAWWIKQIRNLLDPPSVIPLRGSPCRECKALWVAETDPDGGKVFQPALTAYPSETPMRVLCSACETEWVGELAIQLLGV